MLVDPGSPGALSLTPRARAEGEAAAQPLTLVIKLNCRRTPTSACDCTLLFTIRLLGPLVELEGRRYHPATPNARHSPSRRRLLGLL